MPTSKNRRKSGRKATGGFKHYVEQRKRIDRKVKKGQYANVEEVRRDARCLADRRKWYERGQSRMAWLTMLAARPIASTPVARARTSWLIVLTLTSR